VKNRDRAAETVGQVPTGCGQQEETARQLIDAMNDTVLVIGPKGKYIEANKRAVEALGYSRAELLTMGPVDIDPHLDSAEIGERIAATSSGKPLVFETRQRAKNGTTIPVEISSGPWSYQGQPAVLSIARDITDRNRAADALRALSRHNEAILKTIPDIVVEIDTTKTYTQVNDAARRFFGDDVVGKEASFYLEDKNDSYGAVGLPFEGDSDVYYVESWQRRCDGERRLLAWWCRSLKDDDGNVTGALSSARDITEQRQADMMKEARLRLLEIAAAGTVEDLLRATLDELETLTDSQIGFCNLLEPDQDTVTSAALSTRTVKEFCQADRRILHLSVSQSGVWADCIREGRPVVHNDYAALPHRRGTPRGHAVLVRELAVPVFRDDKIVAAMVVGNKPRDYTERDVATVSSLADLPGT
jgi:PAS domain S-box-containing protein